WNADTVVLDRHDYIAAVARRPQSDVALARREFESVVEQVAKYLGEPDRIGMDVNRLGRQVDFEAMGGLFRERLTDFERQLDDGRQVEARQAQIDLAAADPAHVEQIID